MNSNILNFKIYGMPLPLFTFTLVSVLLAHFYDLWPNDLVGGFAFCFVFGAIFGEIGKRIPYFNTYIGGAPVLIFLMAAFFVYMNWFTAKEIKLVSDFTDKSNFLNLFICVLITGAILAVNRKLLLRSLIGYIPTILMAIIGAAIFGVIIGTLFGIEFNRIIMIYVLPIMGGGNGAGAIPLSEIYASVTGGGDAAKKEFYSVAIAILTIANIFAIIFAAVLNQIGKKYPQFSGEGKLVKSGDFAEEDEKGEKMTLKEVAVGLVLSTTCFLFSYVVAKKILPLIISFPIHQFAIMVILVAVLNGFNLVPVEIKEGAKKLSDFFSKQLLWVLMVGVGVAYTDLQEIIDAATLTNVVVAAFIVLGAIVGAWAGALLVSFYPIEAAITAGLCMANRGGSGDLEVLGASERMSLMSYAQISSRLGGGIVLVIASVVFSIIA